jgi:hypothetical protein
MINEIGSKKYQANKLDNNFGTEGVMEMIKILEY